MFSVPARHVLGPLVRHEVAYQPAN